MGNKRGRRREQAEARGESVRFRLTSAELADLQALSGRLSLTVSEAVRLAVASACAGASLGDYLARRARP